MRLASWLFVLTAIVCVMSSNALAQERRWGNYGTYGDIIATDCIDCGEDVGMTISCQGEGSNALVRVPFAAAQRFVPGLVRLVANVDGQDYPFDATFEEQGLVGFVPIFELPANHALVYALAAGAEVRISVEQASVVLGLVNSRQTLDIFRAHCGWTQMPPYGTDQVYVADQPAQPTGEDLPRWYLLQAPDENGVQILTLEFGIPQTDNVLLRASCDIDNGQSEVELNGALDFGALGDGDQTQVEISTRTGQFTYPATVFIASEESAGVSIKVGSRAPLWRALQATDNVTLAVVGGAFTSFSTGDEDEVVKSFVEACFAQKPVDQPTVVKQKVEEPAEKRMVDTPKDPAPKEDPARGKNEEANKPDNAAATKTSYFCDDGDEIVLAVMGSTASLTVNEGAAIQLKAEGGKSFTGEDTKVDVIDSRGIDVTRNDEKVFCEAD